MFSSKSISNIIYYISNTEYPMEKTKANFDAVVISEPRNMKRESPIKKINLKNYSLAVGTFFTFAVVFPTNVKVI